MAKDHTRRELRRIIEDFSSIWIRSGDLAYTEVLSVSRQEAGDCMTVHVVTLPAFVDQQQ